MNIDNTVQRKAILFRERLNKDNNSPYCINPNDNKSNKIWITSKEDELKYSKEIEQFIKTTDKITF